MSAPRYHFRVLQPGQLPLRPDDWIDSAAEHRCTSVLVWPAGETPSADNAVLTDPCFTRAGCRIAVERAAAAGADLARLRYVFETHDHHDHLLSFPVRVDRGHFVRFPDRTSRALEGLRLIDCPGHSPDMRALVFADEAGRSVWVVGDAVLNRDWLLAWGYYWPNGYEREEVVQTWRSVGRIVACADVIVPGHGEAIEVTAGLLAELCTNYPRAEYGERCPEVLRALRERLRHASV